MNKPLKFVAACRLPTEWGVFTLHGFEEVRSGQEHVALSMGDIGSDAPVLARVHSECLTGDALFSQKCDCGPQLQAAMQAVQQAGCGVIVYLRQEGRGIGLINKIRAYQLQDQGLDTVEANVALGLPVDARDFTLAKHIFDHLGVRSVKLLTNNPQKVQVLGDAGNFYAPTVLADVPLDADVFNHEPFGPVIAMRSFDTLDSAIAEATRLPYGLAAYAFTASLKNAHQLSHQVETGMLWINQPAVASAEMPFGGVKDSGYGSEGGTEALEAYLIPKAVSIAMV